MLCSQHIPALAVIIPPGDACPYLGCHCRWKDPYLHREAMCSLPQTGLTCASAGWHGCHALCTTAAILCWGCYFLKDKYQPGPINTGAHYLTFWWKSAAMTAAFPWTSLGVATGYRGNPRVSKARATAHGAFTANATVVAEARAAGLSMTNSVVPTMATHRIPR